MPQPAAAVSAPWIAQQLQSLLAQSGHAWLLAGPSGLGQFELALALVRAWLCEQPSALGACGSCASCHAIDVRTHADLCLLAPETMLLEQGWPLDDKAQAEIDSKKRKPSKEIRIQSLRQAIEFSQRTSARGRGKAVLVFPAECMNEFSANALLKTLEEPAAGVRFVLATDAAHMLLPTIRSRCLVHTMSWPDFDLAWQWLQAQGLPAGPALLMLRACGARPFDAHSMAWLAQRWPQLPLAVLRGDAAAFKDCSPAQALDILYKLCHDLLLRKAGAAPRYFDADDLPSAGSWRSLSAWARALNEARRTVEHPFNAELMLDAWLAQAQLALHAKP